MLWAVVQFLPCDCSLLWHWANLSMSVVLKGEGSESDFASQGMYGNVRRPFGCHHCAYIIGIHRVKTNSLQCIGWGPTAKNYLVQNVSIAMVEKLWAKGSLSGEYVQFGFGEHICYLQSLPSLFRKSAHYIHCTYWPCIVTPRDKIEDSFAL